VRITEPRQRALRWLERQPLILFFIVLTATASVAAERVPLATTHGQAWLGHKNIQHTVRYTELAPDRFKHFWR
jgi:hypothetical protein